MADHCLIARKYFVSLDLFRSTPKCPVLLVYVAVLAYAEYSKNCLIKSAPKEISLKMSCADPEMFVWRAGYYRPYRGLAIEMAFCWPADCGPTLNADFVALRVLVDYEPVLLIVEQTTGQKSSP